MAQTKAPFAFSSNLSSTFDSPFPTGNSSHHGLTAEFKGRRVYNAAVPPAQLLT